MCSHRRLRLAWASAQTDQSLRCPHEETLGPQRPLSTQRRLIRLGGYPDCRLSEPSLGAHAILLVLTWGGSFFVLFAGSHKGTGFQPMKWVVPKTQSTFYLCACKYTDDPPNCSGHCVDAPLKVLERNENCSFKEKHQQDCKLCTKCGWAPDFWKYRRFLTNKPYLYSSCLTFEKEILCFVIFRYVHLLIVSKMFTNKKMFFIIFYFRIRRCLWVGAYSTYTYFTFISYTYTVSFVELWHKWSQVLFK